MRQYGRELFDECLFAITSELVRAEEMNPEWPEDIVSAAQIVHQKAEKLLLASKDSLNNNADAEKCIVDEAVETGAMALRLLLHMSNRQWYEIGITHERERLHWEDYD
jgi:hypothetical protein